MRREKGKLSISKKTFFTLALAGLLTLSGCGSSGSSSYSTHRSDDSYGAKSSKMMSGAGYTNSVDSVAGADDSYYEESYESYDEVAEADVETESTSDVTDKENTTNKIDTEKLIYRCTISLETLDFAGSISNFQQLIKKYDGFVESENTSVRNSGYGYDNGLGYYTATVRVPSDKYDDFVNSTGDIGTLQNKSQNVTNVSQEYSDLSIELEVLEAQKDDYMEMLKEAKKLEDMDNVIRVSDKITEVSTKINQIKTRMNTIDNDVAYSYVDVTISEVKEVTEYSDETFGSRFKKEVKQGWYDFGYGCQQFLIWFVANLWGILLFLGIVFLIIFIIKKIIKKAAKKAEARRQARLEQAMQYGNPRMNPGAPAGTNPSIYARPAQPPVPPANVPAANDSKENKKEQSDEKKQKHSRFRNKKEDKTEENENAKNNEKTEEDKQ